MFRGKFFVIKAASLIFLLITCPIFAETISYDTCCATGCPQSFVPNPMESVLIMAAQKGDIHKARSTLRSGVNINACKKTVNMFCEALTPLMAACRAVQSEPEMVRFLINHGAEINIQNDKGLTALMICSNRGLADSVRILLDHGADISLEDVNGKTAAHMAAETNQLDIVKMLTGQESPKSLVTSLLLGAVWGGNIARTKLMIDQGADVNATNFFGQPPIMIAAELCNAEIARSLIEAGADVNFTYPSTSTTPLKVAVERGCSSVRDLILGERFEQ